MTRGGAHGHARGWWEVQAIWLTDDELAMVAQVIEHERSLRGLADDDVRRTVTGE